MKPKPEVPAINDRLKEFIDSYLQISVSKFARSLDKVPTQNINDIIGGKHKKPSSVLIKKVKKRYPDLSIEWLMMGTGKMLSSESTVISSKEDVPKNDKDKSATKKREFELMAPIIARVKSLRIGAGYTTEDMAKLLGLSTTGYASIEQGLVFFSVPKLIKIRQVFKRSYNYILDGIDEKIQQEDLKSKEEKDKEIAHLKREITHLEKQIDLLNELRNKK